MDESWRTRSACAGMPPHIFVPDNVKDENRAKAVCARCPVDRECLDEALAEGHLGVWGGLNDAERRVVLRRRRLTNVR